MKKFLIIIAIIAIYIAGYFGYKEYHYYTSRKQLNQYKDVLPNADEMNSQYDLDIDIIPAVIEDDTIPHIINHYKSNTHSSMNCWIEMCLADDKQASYGEIVSAYYRMIETRDSSLIYDQNNLLIYIVETDPAYYFAVYHTEDLVFYIYYDTEYSPVTVYDHQDDVISTVLIYTDMIDQKLNNQ